MNSDLPTPKIRFGCNPALRWFILTPFSLFFLAGVGLMFDYHENGMLAAGALISGLMGFFLLGTYYLLNKTSLTISFQGLHIRLVGVNVETPWENVERLYLENSQFGLVTRQPMTGKGVERFARNRDIGEPGAVAYDANAFQWLGERRYLPLRGFEHTLKSGKLQTAMRRYVPDLPGTVVQPPQPTVKTPMTPKQKRATALFVIIMIAALGLGIFLAASDHNGRARNIIYGVSCLLGGLRTGISAIACWRNHKFLSLTYFVLALMLALLSLACFAPDDPSSHPSSKKRPVPAPTAPSLHPQ